MAARTALVTARRLQAVILVIAAVNIVVATVAAIRWEGDPAGDQWPSADAAARGEARTSTSATAPPSTEPAAPPSTDEIVIDAAYVEAHPPSIDIASPPPPPEGTPFPGGPTEGSTEPGYESMWGPPGTMEAIIRRYFTGPEGDRAVEIVQCESQMNPNAVSDTDDYGLFQINAVHREGFVAVTGAPWDWVFHPEYNAVFAHYLWSEFGWSRWTCDRMV